MWNATSGSAASCGTTTVPPPEQLACCETPLLPVGAAVRFPVWDEARFGRNEQADRAIWPNSRGHDRLEPNCQRTWRVGGVFCPYATHRCVFLPLIAFARDNFHGAKAIGQIRSGAGPQCQFGLPSKDESRDRLDELPTYRHRCGTPGADEVTTTSLCTRNTGRATGPLCAVAKRFLHAAVLVSYRPPTFSPSQLAFPPRQGD